jgi:hypothetical protein
VFVADDVDRRVGVVSIRTFSRVAANIERGVGLVCVKDVCRRDAADEDAE